MQTIEKSITIQATPQDVYAFLRDPENMPRWMSSLSRVRNVHGEGVGQTYDWTYSMAGIPLDGNTVVLEDVAGEHVKTRTRGGVDSTWLITLRGDGTSTEVVLRVDYEVPIPVLGALAEKLIVSRNEREMEANLQNAKDLIEG